MLRMAPLCALYGQLPGQPFSRVLLHFVVFYTLKLQHVMHAYSIFQLSHKLFNEDIHDNKMHKPKHLRTQYSTLLPYSSIFFLSGCEGNEAHSCCFQLCPWQQKH